MSSEACTTDRLLVEDERAVCSARSSWPVQLLVSTPPMARGSRGAIERQLATRRLSSVALYSIVATGCLSPPCYITPRFDEYLPADVP